MENQSPQNAAPSLLPQHIRESLKSFDKHKTLTCLECGYTGLMGIKAEIEPWWATTKGLIAIITISVLGLWFVVGSLPWYFNIGIAVVAAALGKIATKHLVVCPNCKAELMK